MTTVTAATKRRGRFGRIGVVLPIPDTDISIADRKILSGIYPGGLTPEYAVGVLGDFTTTVSIAGSSVMAATLQGSI